MTVLFLLPLLLLTALSTLTSAAPDSDYHESLVLQPLPQSSLLASFNFRSNTSQESFEQRHFRYFPRALGQILQHANTKELHLRFTTGRWDAESWGSRPWNGSKEGNTGVELWAWIDAPDDDGYVVPGYELEAREANAELLKGVREMDHLDPVLVGPFLCVHELYRFYSNYTANRIL